MLLLLLLVSTRMYAVCGGNIMLGIQTAFGPRWESWPPLTELGWRGLAGQQFCSYGHRRQSKA